MPLKSSPLPTKSMVKPASKQQGVVLFIALIILVAMSLAAIALIRSVSTTNVIAGNMSFHQSATLAGEKSTEYAVTNWLEPKSTKPLLDLDNNSVGTGLGTGNGYLATRADPAAGTSWDAFWVSTLQAQAKILPIDDAGNTVWYVIHRLCDSPGPPTPPNNCAKPPGGSGGSNTSGAINFPNDQVYYRITTRIEGPRNTVAYIQTVVAL